MECPWKNRGKRLPNDVGVIRCLLISEAATPWIVFPSHFCATNKRKQTVLVPSLSKLPGDHRVNIYDLALPFWMTLGNEVDFPRNDAVSNLRQVRKV